MYKICRRHHCSARHRTFATAAKCMFRKSTWHVYGDGPYVVVDKHRTPNFTRDLYLYKTLSEAETKHMGPCSGSHIEFELCIIVPLDQLEQWQ